MTPRAEHHKGWREPMLVGEVSYLVEARHHTRKRLPKPHEWIRHLGLGPYLMVEELDYEWVVIHDRKPLIIVRQNDAGVFTCFVNRQHRTLRARVLKDAVKEATNAIRR